MSNDIDDIIVPEDSIKSSFLLQFAKYFGLTILILGALAAIVGAVGLAVPAVAAITAGIFGMANAGAGVASMLSGATIVGGVLTGAIGLNIYQAGRIAEFKRTIQSNNMDTDIYRTTL